MNLPDRSFWSRSVSANFDPADLMKTGGSLLRANDFVTSAGSCFASNLIPFIESAGLSYIRTESLPEVFTSMGENLGYANFSAAYGNIYTARQLRQLYERAIGKFKPVDDRFDQAGKMIDLLRPGLKFPANSESEFDYITAIHLVRTKEAFDSADVFVFTLGLTEGWISKVDGTTYPSCPGTIGGEFDETKYQFKNFSVAEIVEDLSAFIELLRTNNPNVRFILSVSPVPLVATATSNHVLTSTVYSKSVLRVAAEEITSNFANVSYFPAYEIITGPQAPETYFETDRRNVSKTGVQVVMNSLLIASGLTSMQSLDKPVSKKKKVLPPKIGDLSRRISQAECDEVMIDKML
jgi:hypothetical protein